MMGLIYSIEVNNKVFMQIFIALLKPGINVEFNRILVMIIKI